MKEVLLEEPSHEPVTFYILMVCWILSLKSLDIWNKGKPISFVSESFDSEHFIHCKAMTVRCQLRMEHILSWKSFHFDRTHLKLSVEFQYFISWKGILIIEALDKMDNLFQQFLALGSASKDIPFWNWLKWSFWNWNTFSAFQSSPRFSENW